MKKTFSFLLTLSLLLVAFSGCQSAKKDNGGTIDQNETNTSESNLEKASPVADFEYIENENGGITITLYKGNDKDVIIPSKINGKDVTVIGENAFEGNNLCSVKMPNSVTVIEKVAFRTCVELKEVFLSQNLKVIEGGSFISCYSLSSIDFPETLESIGEVAFEDCKSLNQIALPKGLNKLGKRAFANCEALKHINIPAQIAVCEREAFVYSGLETIVIEDGVEVIGEGAFAGTQIKELVLPNSVKKISNSAFCACYQLKRVTLNAGLVTIEDYAFDGVRNLKEIVIPNTVQNITEMAFNWAQSLEKVFFEGDAPSNFVTDGVSAAKVSYTIYYHQNAKGFTSPTWNGYPTSNW